MPLFRLSVPKNEEKEFLAAVMRMHTPFVESNSDRTQAWIIVECDAAMAVELQAALKKALRMEIGLDPETPVPVTIRINDDQLTLIEAATLAGVVELYVKKLYRAARNPENDADARENAAVLVGNLTRVCKLLLIDIES